MNNYEWNYFQKLIRVHSDEEYIYIENDKNQTLKMSKGSYKESADIVFSRPMNLLEKTYIQEPVKTQRSGLRMFGLAELA
ncbi:hypothetical protein CJF42_17520 [Pseudoalteromonas sp. NBT06-2]|uniref:hypothetical protein n=1 Tax=Pseudoalteromonas sp. NBT06-2 TaxID=2025950 RepID=UPI000BA647E3|nr:hypothetical protein [Pseudoalteromonas sp. NBT06-2]PAJ73102.1 hypothetical protein CJF42_17520 [Pseudoalteromonas sp. NBT06-2]